MDPDEINLDDDDYVVLVISNEDEDIMPLTVKKEEVKEEQETLDETLFSVDYYDHQELDQDEFAELPKNDDYQEEYSVLDEDFFIDNDKSNQLISENDQITQEYLEKVKKNVPQKSHWKCVPFEYQRSFVEELRNQYPELRNDEQKLVAKLVEVMKNCTPEEPPEDFLTGPDTLECAICYFNSRTVGEAKRHYQWKHGPRYLTCYACGNDYRCSINLTKHEKKCKGEDAHIVMKARAICVGRRGFNRPFLDLSIREGTGVKKIKKTPGEKKKQYKYGRFDCDECTATFRAKQSYIAHVNLHKGLRPYQCEECPMAYTSQMGLKRHLRIHKPATYICDICGFEFYYRNAIISHLNTHLPRRKYACTFPNCVRRFAQRSTLRVHVDVDHGNQPLPYGCNFCDKRCRRMTHLKEHMKKAHGMLLMTRAMFVRSLPKLDIQELASIGVEDTVAEVIENV